MIKNFEIEKSRVLVGILKNVGDLDILFQEHWYRVPEMYMPVRPFHYLAFYQPAIFGTAGNCIRYYAPVRSYQKYPRIFLLPKESDHPRRRNTYIKLNVGRIKALRRPIRNKPPRRIVFGFTTLGRLFESRSMLQLYNVPPTEQIMESALRKAGIRALAQYYVLGGKRRYRLDFAVFCKKGTIAIECDNNKAHRSFAQHARDRAKDRYLRRLGWTVFRFKEDEIVWDAKRCVARVKAIINNLGGTT